MKPLDPRLLRLSRTARGAVAASAATGLVRTLATVAIAWGIATAVTLGVDGVRDRVVPAALTPTLALLGAAFVVRAVAAWATDDLAARAGARVKSELRATVLARAAERGPAWLQGRSSAAFATTLGPGLDALDAYFGRFLPQLALTAVATPVLLLAIGAGDLTSGRHRARDAGDPGVHGAHRARDPVAAASAGRCPRPSRERVHRGRRGPGDAEGVRPRPPPGRPDRGRHRRVPTRHPRRPAAVVRQRLRARARREPVRRARRGVDRRPARRRLARPGRRDVRARPRAGGLRADPAGRRRLPRRPGRRRGVRGRPRRARRPRWTRPRRRRPRR